MAYYLVKAKPYPQSIAKLKRELDDGKIDALKPFGKAMAYSLRNARYSFDGYIVWEEEDYCSPPLAMEREEVLDKYFKELAVKPVEKDAGWGMIKHLPKLWLLHEGLPKRTGERPLTRMMPHQQVSQNPPIKIYNKLARLLFNLPDVAEEVSRISVPGARALRLVADKINNSPSAFMIEREFAHLHPHSDGSMHLMAPPSWVGEILEKGWGERHPLAGRMIPSNAVMVYAPRNEEEVEIIYDIVLLSYWRARGENIVSPRTIV